MKKIFLFRVVLAVICSCFSLFASAQVMYKIKESSDIDMKLSGTSTMHKWVMNAKTFTGAAQFQFDTLKGHQLSSLNELTFSLEVENLKSDEKILNENAYKALKTDEYKDIDYRLLSSEIFKAKANQYVIHTHGNLSIAGVTRPIEMEVYCNVNPDSTITCTGSEKLKMTDYKVRPPSFMLGAMKTGDDITLDFILVYKIDTSQKLN